MRQHNGMRPQDVVILLKIISKGKTSWQYKDLAAELYISNAEIMLSLNRSYSAGLVGGEKKEKVFKAGLMEFIEHGLRYVFPVHPGTLVSGMPTAHSHPFMKSKFSSQLDYVWPHQRGEIQGLAIEPLYKETVRAVQLDPILYKMLALIDVLRVGRVREWKIAIAELKAMIDEK